MKKEKNVAKLEQKRVKQEEKARKKQQKKQQKKQKQKPVKAAKPDKKKQEKKTQKPKTDNSKKAKKKGNKAKISIRMEIFAVTLIPLVLLAVVITTYTVHSMRTSLAEQTISGLKDLSNSVKGAYDTLDRGKYEMNGNYLRKGEYEITKNESMLDSFVADSDVEVSLFFGDTVAATSMTSHKTGEKIRGEKAPEQVVKKEIGRAHV